MKKFSISVAHAMPCWVVLALTLGFGEVWAAEVIPAARRVPWQGNVGIPGGIPDSSGMTVFANFTSSATLAQVVNSLSSCPSNQVVTLAAGTYNWSGDFDWQGIGNGKVLRGAVDANGIPTTKIKSSGSVVLMRAIASETALSTDAALTADGNKGDTTITLASVPSWVTVNEVIGIDQLDDTSLSFNPGQESGTSYRQIMGNGARGMAMLLKVTAKTATTISFELPLAWTFATANTAQIFNPLRDLTTSKKTRSRCGMENLVWEHTGASQTDTHMFKLETCEQCWLKNVYGTNLIGGIYVFGVGSYRCEIRHCRFDDCKSLGGGQGYGIGLYHFNTGWLIEDNIFRKLHVGMQNNYGSCYNVFAYNFETDGQSDSGQNPGMSGHGTTGYMTLFEGNWCMDKFLGDFTHGAGCYYTIFRNRIVGKNPNQTGDQTAFSNERYNRKVNAVGNVMGLPGWHNTYMTAPSGSGYPGAISTCNDKSIYKFGFWANIGCNSSAVDSYATMDPIIALNFDTVTSTNSGVVLGGSVNSDLVNSYYLPGKPAWFGDRPWPPYGPSDRSSTNSMSYTNIPAGYRYAFGRDSQSGPVNQAPVAMAGASSLLGLPLLPLTFSSAGSYDPEGAPLSYSWNFGDGSPLSTLTAPLHTFLTEGSFVVTLTVSDGTNSASSSVTILVGNQPPVVSATANPLSGTPPLAVAFSSAGTSDPEGAALSYTWSFGDGTANSTVANPLHTYAALGVYTARLIVSDGVKSATNSVLISVVNPSTGLVAAYGFEEGSGTVLTDLSGNSNHGVISGGIWTTGRYGKAISFNGSSSMVTVNNSASLGLSTAMTLSAWVYPTSLGGWRDIIYKADDIYLLEGSTPTGPPCTGGTFAGASLYGTNALPLNMWSHLAATYDGSTMRLYVNGVQVASRAQTGAIASSTNPLTIGGDASGQYWAGRIDEVRIYNRALSPAQILTDKMTTTTGLVAPVAPTNPTGTPL